jgi:hypothetical protein
MLQCTLRLYGQVKNQREARVDGSVRMPAYRPHVVASFCSANLVGDHNKSFGTVNARRAGAEPWAICDYIRDALCWPMDFLFIDAEQAGMYDVDHYEYARSESDPSR